MTGRQVARSAVEAAVQAAEGSGGTPRASEVGPGLVGFLATFAVVSVTVLLMLDLTRRLRRLRYRADLADRGGADGLPEGRPGAGQSDAPGSAAAATTPTAHTGTGREPHDRTGAAAVEQEVGDERDT